MPPTGQQPASFSTATKQWRQAIIDTYDLKSHHMTLLDQAAAMKDEIERHQTTLAHEGYVVATKAGGLKAHPVAALLRDARVLHLKYLRELGLDVEETTRGPGRPPHSLLYANNGGRRV